MQPRISFHNLPPRQRSLGKTEMAAVLGQGSGSCVPKGGECCDDAECCGDLSCIPILFTCEQ